MEAEQRDRYFRFMLQSPFFAPTPHPNKKDFGGLQETQRTSTLAIGSHGNFAARNCFVHLHFSYHTDPSGGPKPFGSVGTFLLCDSGAAL